jgi:hypothetical protein
MITRPQSPHCQGVRVELPQLAPERACCFAIDCTTNRQMNCKDGFGRHNAPGTTVQIYLDAIRPASAKSSDDGCSGVGCHRARGRSDRPSRL